MIKSKSGISRRNFLKTGAAAAAAGVAGVWATGRKTLTAADSAASAMELDYQNPGRGQWSKLRPKPNYGGASVRYVEHNDEWLGTTQIVGGIKQTREIDSGFSLAIRGLLGEKARWGFLSQSKRYPLTAGFSLGIGVVSEDHVVSGEPAPQKLPIPDPEQMSKHIKDTCYYLRADEVGIGRMPEYAYYSHKHNPPQGAFPAGHADPDAPLVEYPVERSEYLPYVITFAVEQHLETYLASTGYDGISVSQSFRSYHATANIAVILAQYIRSLGYRARASHFGNYQAAMPPALIASGMGEMTRTGDCVAHPRIGFRSKVAAVTTDLPLAPDKPIDFGMLDFCRVCMKCAENCPAQSISFERDPIVYNGYMRWDSDMAKCTAFRAGNDEGVNCGRCLKVCPWNSKEDSWFHEAGIWLGSKGEAASTLLKSIDDIFGYGTEEIQRYKWWLEWPELYKVYAPGQSTPL
ncbi:MAG: reductive dehalogenase [Gracilibacteraceae bacterium]|jgi:reductive dehalogenase|nr:reductive dehalogenase [Gracilibacteraceae bacterium]